MTGTGKKEVRTSGDNGPQTPEQEGMAPLFSTNTFRYRMILSLPIYLAGFSTCSNISSLRAVFLISFLSIQFKQEFRFCTVCLIPGKMCGVSGSILHGRTWTGLCGSRRSRFSGNTRNLRRTPQEFLSRSTLFPILHIPVQKPAVLGLPLPDIEEIKEMVYSPWTDLDRIMREQKIPLFGLESQEPVKEMPRYRRDQRNLQSAPDCKYRGHRRSPQAMYRILIIR